MSSGFVAIAAMLKTRSGLILGPEKTYLLETRLAALMKQEGVRTIDALAEKLRPGSQLERDVVDAMTTNESLFFRDGKPFDALRQRIFPRLHAARPAAAPLRIWSAAASTGQEAYSIAMIAAEMATSMPGRRVEIVGTDIAREPLQRAREGLYTQFEVQRGLSMQSLVKHFTKQDCQWRIKQALRDMVTFREWNLLADLRALGHFDVVFCRNVLIYFDTVTKSQVLNAIVKQIAADGVLFLGGAETVLGLTDAFQAIQGENGAYQPAGTLAKVS